MIRKLVDFSLDNRFLVLAAAFLLLGWGAISFHQLPVEAYPDVANNYVDIITQWHGISAEQIEQQISIPLEVAIGRGFWSGSRRLPCRRGWCHRWAATGALSAKSTSSR